MPEQRQRDSCCLWWRLPLLSSPAVAGITVATMGALVLVQLIRVGGATSPAYLIGFYASSWLAQGFLAISAFLGALGSFFSGSTTVSNLTFGDIQMVRLHAALMDPQS
jgi:L-lactate permease